MLTHENGIRVEPGAAEDLPQPGEHDPVEHQPRARDRLDRRPDPGRHPVPQPGGALLRGPAPRRRAAHRRRASARRSRRSSTSSPSGRSNHGQSTQVAGRLPPHRAPDAGRRAGSAVAGPAPGAAGGVSRSRLAAPRLPGRVLRRRASTCSRCPRSWIARCAQLAPRRRDGRGDAPARAEDRARDPQAGGGRRARDAARSCGTQASDALAAQARRRVRCATRAARATRSAVDGEVAGCDRVAARAVPAPRVVGRAAREGTRRAGAHRPPGDPARRHPARRLRAVGAGAAAARAAGVVRRRAPRAVRFRGDVEGAAARSARRAGSASAGARAIEQALVGADGAAVLPAAGESRRQAARAASTSSRSTDRTRRSPRSASGCRSSSQLLKALQVAELEVEGSYVEDLHDPIFAALDESGVTAAGPAVLPRLPRLPRGAASRARTAQLARGAVVRRAAQGRRAGRRPARGIRAGHGPLRVRPAQRAARERRHELRRRVRAAVRRVEPAAAARARAAGPASPGPGAVQHLRRPGRAARCPATCCGGGDAVARVPGVHATTRAPGRTSRRASRSRTTRSRSATGPSRRSATPTRTCSRSREEVAFTFVDFALCDPRYAGHFARGAARRLGRVR